MSDSMQLAVIVKGEIVSSNFKEFCTMVDTTLAGINTDLKTDVDFGNATEDVKTLKGAEENIKGIREDVLSQMESVNEILTGLESKGENVRQVRLDLSRKILSQKNFQKELIIDDAVERINCDWRETYRHEVATSTKGMSKLESMEKATVAVADKINTKHDRNREIINKALLEHGAGIAPDHRQLLDMDEQPLRDQIDRRVELKKVEDEKKELEAKRIAAEKELAEMKRAEAEKAKATEEPPQCTVRVFDTAPGQLQPPEPQKVTGIKTNRPTPIGQPETAKEESARYLEALKASFAPSKEARAALKHPENIAAAGRWSASLLTAWKTLKGEVE